MERGGEEKGSLQRLLGCRRQRYKHVCVCVDVRVIYFYIQRERVNVFDFLNAKLRKNSELIMC